MEKTRRLWILSLAGCMGGRARPSTKCTRVMPATEQAHRLAANLADPVRGRDTATPPAWAELAAQTLANSFVYHVPMVGHGVIDGGDCPVFIGLQFLHNPYAEPDAACISRMNTSFYIP